MCGGEHSRLAANRESSIEAFPRHAAAAYAADVEDGPHAVTMTRERSVPPRLSTICCATRSSALYASAVNGPHGGPTKRTRQSGAPLACVGSALTRLERLGAQTS